MGWPHRDVTQQDQPVPLFHPPLHTCGHTRVLKEEPLDAFQVPGDLHQARATQWFCCYQLAFTQRIDQIHKAR